MQKNVLKENLKIAKIVFLMHFLTPSKKFGPNLKPDSDRFCLNFMKMVNKSCLVQQMTEKITVEVDAKICFGKKYKNLQVSLINEDV